MNNCIDPVIYIAQSEPEIIYNLEKSLEHGSGRPGQVLLKVQREIVTYGSILEHFIHLENAESWHPDLFLEIFLFIDVLNDQIQTQNKKDTRELAYLKYSSSLYLSEYIDSNYGSHDTRG